MATLESFLHAIQVVIYFLQNITPSQSLEIKHHIVFVSQKQHVGKSKSSVARESALRFAPEAKIKVIYV